jgi:hypothetical protein
MTAARPFTRHDVRFPAGQDTCAGWLFLPDGVTSLEHSAGTALALLRPEP